MMFLAINCDGEAFITILKVVSSFVRILYVLIAVGLIIFAMVDFMKVVMSEKVENGAAFKTFIKKLITTVFAFLIIPIVILFMDIMQPKESTNATVKGCTDVIIRGLLNPGKLKVVPNDDSTDIPEEDKTRLVAFKERCDVINGLYEKKDKATYKYDDANVVDFFEDETSVHVCKNIGQ